MAEIVVERRAVAPELAAVERAKRENWSRQELRLSLICAAPLLTEAEIERVVAAMAAAAVTGEGGPGR